MNLHNMVLSPVKAHDQLAPLGSPKPSMVMIVLFAEHLA